MVPPLPEVEDDVPLDEAPLVPVAIEDAEPGGDDEDGGVTRANN